MRDLKALVEELAAGKGWARPGPYDKGSSRTIESTVVLGKAKGGENAGEVVLELSVSHDKGRKNYYSRLQISTQRQDGPFKVNSYSLFDKETGARLDQVDSPRYSAKALEAFWELQIGKLKDDPNILTALNLDHNQEQPAEPESEEEENGWFPASDLLEPLKAEGLDKATVEQTGGGTATFYIQQEPHHDMVTVGPGSFHWGEPDKSLFTLDEFYYGMDCYDNDGELRDEDPENHRILPGTSMADAAKTIAEFYRKLNNL